MPVPIIVRLTPENWREVRARWIRFHIVRTLVSVPALVSYLLCILLDGS